MKKRRFSEYGYYRSPRTTQERRMSYAHGKYVRGKRRGKNLPSSYDDIHVSIDRKCWKSKREKQYRIGKRGQKHEVFLEYWVHDFYITSYLEEQDIPYRIEDVRKGYTYIRYDGEECHSSREIGHILTYWTDKNIEFPREAFRERIGLRCLVGS